MSDDQKASQKQENNSQFIQAIIAFMVFCGFSLLSKVSYPIFGLAAMLGIGFPLVWGRFIDIWGEIDFTRKRIRLSILLGITGGILTNLIGIMLLRGLSIPKNLGLQLAVGIPGWASLASPFQEFFFRGWLQTRFENRLGNWWGLIFAIVCSILWQYTTPCVDATPVPLKTLVGVLATFGAGLIYACIFQGSRNSLAPWWANLLSGFTFIIVGAMDFRGPLMRWKVLSPLPATGRPFGWTWKKHTEE